MANYNQPIPGATTVIAELELRNNPDLPVVDANRVRGGGFAVDTLALRNSMPSALRKAGVSRCYVKETDTTYLLKGGILNTDWVPDLATPTLEVGAFLGTATGQVGQVFSLTLPANLFVSKGGVRTWSVDSMQGVPAGLNVDKIARIINGTPTTSGLYYLVINGVDTDNNMCQYVLPFLVAAAAGATTPAVPGTPSLEVGAALGSVQAQVGQVFSLTLPANLFVSKGGVRTWSIDSVQGVPDGLSFTPSSLTLGGTPTTAGRFDVVFNAVDTDSNRCQYVLPCVIAAATTTNPNPSPNPNPTPTPAPTTVGAAAINIVANNTAACSIKLVTAGLSETGAVAYSSTDNTKRFIGGQSVTGALAFGSAGYASVSGGIGYYSFGFNVAQFRSRYPYVNQVVFDVIVNPTPTPYYINRVNYSYLLSDGFVAQTLANSFDYDYKNPGAQTKGFYHFNKGQSGAENQDYDLKDQFTLAGGEDKKIGTMTLNMSTGVCRFEPVPASTTTPTPTPTPTPNPATDPTEDDFIDSITRKEIGTDVLYFIRMAYWKANDAMRPIIRSRNAAETNWRGSGWTEWIPEVSSTQYSAQYAAGYHYVWRGNMSLNNEVDFSMVIQFNDNTGAPAWSIVEDAYQATTQPAEVEIYNAQTWRNDKRDGTDGYDSGTPATTYTDETLPKAVSGNWFQGEYTFNANGQIQIYGNPEPDGLGVQLKIGRQNGQAFDLANDQNPVLKSDTFYQPGPLSGHGDMIQQWTFGKSDGTGGLTVGEGYIVTIINDNGAQQAVSWVPKVGTNQTLFGNTQSTGTGGSGGTGNTSAKAEKQTINYTSSSNDDGGPINQNGQVQ